MIFDETMILEMSSSQGQTNKIISILVGLTFLETWKLQRPRSFFDWVVRKLIVVQNCDSALATTRRETCVADTSDQGS